MKNIDKLVEQLFFKSNLGLEKGLVFKKFMLDFNHLKILRIFTEEGSNLDVFNNEFNVKLNKTEKLISKVQDLREITGYNFFCRASSGNSGIIDFTTEIILRDGVRIEKVNSKLIQIKKLFTVPGNHGRDIENCIKEYITKEKLDELVFDISSLNVEQKKQLNDLIEKNTYLQPYFEESDKVKLFTETLDLTTISERLSIIENTDYILSIFDKLPPM